MTLILSRSAVKIRVESLHNNSKSIIHGVDLEKSQAFSFSFQGRMLFKSNNEFQKFLSGEKMYGVNYATD